MPKKPQIPKQWTEAEEWAWERIRTGQIADFHERYADQLKKLKKKELVPNKPAGWTDKKMDRRLSAAFLTAILIEEEFQKVTPTQGVRIIGAFFEETIDLEHACLEHQFWLDKCRFFGGLNLLDIRMDELFSLEESWVYKGINFSVAKFKHSVNLMGIEIRLNVDMTGTRITETLSMTGSTFKGKLTMNSTKVGQNLLMDKQATFEEVDLTAAEIGGQLLMSGSTFKGKLIMDSTKVTENLVMDEQATFQEVDLTAAKIDGRLSMTGSVFNGKLTINGAEIGQHLFMQEKSIFEEVNLITAKISGQLIMRSSTFNGKLNMNSTKVNQGLFMDDQATFQEVELTTANIGGQLIMKGSTFKGKLNMNGTEVGQGLFMDDQATFQEVELTAAKITGMVSMIGSTFKGKLNMNETEVGQNLFMDKQATFQEVDLTAAKIDGRLSMTGSVFNGKLTMSGTNVGENLFMQEKATFQEVDLGAAKIGGQLSMTGSTFNGKLNMNSTKVGQNLFMDKQATFQEVDLTAAKTDGQLIMRSSTFNGKLNMNSTKVSQGLFMDDQAKFKEVYLTAANIGGALSMDNSTFNDILILEGIVIGGGFFARFTKFPEYQEVNLIYAKIGSSFDLSGATIGAINLTGSTISGELRLGSEEHEPPIWVGQSHMNLRNTTVGAIQDAKPDLDNDSWPLNLELEGFTCHHLGGFGAAGEADIEKRPSKWFVNWLKRNKSFSPQPYQYIAKLLREAGYPSKANAVLFAGRERTRKEAWKNKERFRSFGLWLLKVTIGYGLGGRYFWALGWVFGFTLFGFWVLWNFLPGNIDRDIFTLLWASFDQILPLIELDETHRDLFNKLEVSKLALAYSYVLKLIGYVLGGFLIAGLAGLTQKG